MSTQELFSGLREAKTSETGTFLDPGLYALEITACIAKPLRKGGNAFIVECKVLETTNEKHPVGSKASWFQSFKEKEVAFGAIKLFLYAVLGLDVKADAAQIKETVDPKIEQFVVEAVEKNSLRERKVRVQVSQKKTRAGTDFSLHTFSPYDTK